MLVELKKLYSFEAAHHLPRVPAGHKCSRMHGHSYRVEIALRGPVNPATGWVVDFAVIDDAWADLFRQFDHHTLNDIQGLDNPTCENLCAFIWEALSKSVPHVSAITVWETADSCCVYGGGAG
ncbi:MAG TPA: 6-carboxytetrahydropterin synthase QueD [Polyangia bacterium]